MPITVTCPTCAQLCSVADEYAGAMVKCPKCGNLIQTPPPAGDSAATLPPGTPLPGASAPAPALGAGLPTPPSPPPPAPPFARFMADIDKTAKELGIDPLSKTLIFAGLGCLALMALSVVFHWTAVPAVPREISELLPATMAGHSRLGITLSAGLMNLIITLEVAFFLVFYFFLVKKAELFNLSLWAAAWWGSHATFWRLIDLSQLGSYAGAGQYVALVGSIGAAATFGFVVVQRITRKKSL